MGRGTAPKYSEFYPDLFPGATALFPSDVTTGDDGTLYSITPFWDYPLSSASDYEIAADGTVAPKASCNDEDGDWVYDNYDDWQQPAGHVVGPVMGALSVINAAVLVKVGAKAVKAASRGNFSGTVNLAVGIASASVLMAAAPWKKYAWQKGNPVIWSSQVAPHRPVLACP